MSLSMKKYVLVLVGLAAGLAPAAGCVQGSSGESASGGGAGGASFSDGFDASPAIAFALPPGVEPVFPQTVVASIPPPPISGGTLLATADGKTAVATDPDRDAAYVVDIASASLTHTVSLQPGDQPGRLVEDGAGRVYVAMRGSGAVATIDLATGTVVRRQPACPAPRGLAWNATTNSVLVACATGELVTLPAGGGAATQTLKVERDLRDVLIQGGNVSVTSFRAAQILRLAADGTITRRDQLAASDSASAPHVVWRAVPDLTGNIIAVHQSESTESVSTAKPGGYGGGSGLGLTGLPGGPAFFDASFLPTVADASAITVPNGSDASFLFEGDESLGPLFTGSGSGLFMLPHGIVRSVLEVCSSAGETVFQRVLNGVLPVDVALSPDGRNAAVAEPGNAFTETAKIALVTLPDGNEFDYAPMNVNQPVAVAFDVQSDLLIQTREPARLYILPPGSDASNPTISVDLSSTSREDTGHDVFHTTAGAGVACASCHPEGGDDGHTWLLDDNQRRTPSLRGTIAGTAPYHWPGDQKDLPSLVNDVYTIRMAGSELTPGQMSALTGWLETIPAPLAPSWVDANSASRGKAVFERSDTQCATCHSGDKFTDNATVDVGTGGSFQVPPLVGVGWRAPLMHAGCAATLADRFGKCATPQHGNLASMSQADLTDLIAYLETL